MFSKELVFWHDLRLFSTNNYNYETDIIYYYSSITN